ncbi:hypothetical protein EDD18DRAFT_1359022 [Armillaria luteobubalina]|uniref:DUF6534 domain-containing protein n=1 Tax=Armillaria luteobubalina TaxID=153913 RepID=A0AA39URR9_9AGAR|nr:hypothetical protein EDD18DRAFT_1359022 [Armillaria luteobubalina]
MSLDSTFGAFLIGAIVTAWLFGITCTQTWSYYTRYSDGIFLRALVGIVWTLEAVHAAFACHAAYFYVVTQYGNVAGLSEVTWSASLTVCVTGIITLMVHLFYARQLLIVSNRNVFLVSVLFFLAMGRVASSAAITGYSLKLKLYALFETPVMTNLLKISMCLYLGTDVLVAASLCYYLHTSRTGHKRVTDLLVIIFNRVYPGNLIYLSLYQVVANLYSNSFLASLNFRKPTKMTHINNKSSSEDDIVRIDNFNVISPLQEPSRASGALNLVPHTLFLFLIIEPANRLLLDQQHIDIHITRTTDTIRDADDDSSPEFEPKPTEL